MSIIAQALDVSRSNLYEQVKKSTVRKRKTGDDSADLNLIRHVTDERPSYGYRRVTAILKHRMAVSMAKGMRLKILPDVTLMGVVVNKTAIDEVMSWIGER